MEADVNFLYGDRRVGGNHVIVMKPCPCCERRFAGLIAYVQNPEACRDPDLHGMCRFLARPPP